jgi:molybdopterin-containing oxidoreductase family iron-sulfur binding subunit
LNLSLLGIGAVAGSSILLNACKTKPINPVAKGKIKVLNQQNRLVEVDASSVTLVNVDDTTDYLQKQGREGLDGKKFILVVDLKQCKNARKCMDTCQSVHQLRPEQHHLNVLQMQDNERLNVLYTSCQHCDNLHA